MKCRPGCGACCIAPSISTPLPHTGQPKPAGVPCPHLTANGLCDLFNEAKRPAVCRDFAATPAVCGDDRETALHRLTELERQTAAPNADPTAQGPD